MFLFFSRLYFLVHEPGLVFKGYLLKSDVMELISVNCSRHPNSTAPGIAIIGFCEIVHICAYVHMHACMSVCVRALTQS